MQHIVNCWRILQTGYKQSPEFVITYGGVGHGDDTTTVVASDRCQRDSNTIAIGRLAGKLRVGVPGAVKLKIGGIGENDPPHRKGPKSGLK